MQISSDRNLLFGTLALQNDFVPRDQLVAAMNYWVLEKQTSLREILIRRTALETAVASLLESLAAKHIQRHGVVSKRVLNRSRPISTLARR